MTTESPERPAAEREEQLGWERRWGRWAAAAAFVGALVLFAGQILYPRTDAPQARRDSAVLLTLDRYPEQALAAAACLAIGYALLGATIYYLYRATKFRRPQTLPAAPVLAVLGAAVAAVVSIVSSVIQRGIASDFASGPRTEGRAEEIVRETSLQVVSGLAAAGLLALAFAVVLISVNSMRAGLQSRFMGFFGAFAGAMLILPVLPALQSAWLIALGMLFLGRWPGGGRGPAWETGNPDPWPSPVERREQFEAERAAREAGLTREELEEAEPEPAGAGEAAPEDERGTAAAPAGAARSTRKRKRKRRR